ncbi:hypothetical protein EVAR_60166_1 [Eumeta japonica]|uniref:Uncharacterized protein n=1 Tax=Eumeta variegata TaxID=151549 RepID=A0A4C1SU94_EUMVA|nr:hypothetical protein EVAR_60166_1 [Eumeta japonica]
MTGRKGGKGLGKVERSVTGKCSAITSRGTSRLSVVCSQGRRETYIRSDLRRDARSAESVPRERSNRSKAEGQVKSCNNVDEKRSVGREALITVYPTVRGWSIVAPHVSRTSCSPLHLRQWPYRGRIRSTGDGSAAAAKPRLPRSVGGGGGVVRSRRRTDASKDFEMVNNAIRGWKGAAILLRASKKYIIPPNTR